MSDELDDEGRLIRRIEALEKLLVSHRIGRSPTEKLFAELDRTKEWTRKIVERRAAGA
jgi:hypothetical protein